MLLGAASTAEFSATSAKTASLSTRIRATDLPPANQLLLSEEKTGFSDGSRLSFQSRNGDVSHLLSVRCGVLSFGNCRK